MASDIPRPDDLMWISRLIELAHLPLPKGQRPSPSSHFRGCRAFGRMVARALRKAQITAWDDLEPLSPKFLEKSPVCDFVMGTWSVSYAEARTIWPHYLEERSLPVPDLEGRSFPFAAPGLQVMPDRKARQYKLLWEIADEISQCSRNAPESCFVELIRDFLRGDFAPSGIVYFYPTHDRANPRAFQLYKPDGCDELLLAPGELSFMKKMELQSGIPTLALTIDGLLHWTWRDYQRLPELKEPKTCRQKEYFIERDPCRQFGLFVRREEAEGGRSRANVCRGAEGAASLALKTAEAGKIAIVQPRRQRPRKPAVEGLIAEAKQMVESGEKTKNGAANLIAEREWPQYEKLPAAEKIAQSEKALAQQIRKGVAAELNNQHFTKP